MSLRLGTNRVVVASSASAAREILQKHSTCVSAGNWTDAWRCGRNGDESIFVFQPHHKWRVLRRLGMEKLFSTSRLEDLREQRHNVVRDLLRDVSVHAASGAPVSIGRMTFSAMVNLLWRAIFSTKLEEARSQEIQDCVREAVVLVSAPNVSDFFPAIARADLQGVRQKMSRMIDRVYRQIDQDQQILQRVWSLEYKKEGARMHDLLDTTLDMADHGQGDNGVTMNKDVMRAFCVDLLAGASDTTANTTEWALAELLQSLQSMTKLQEELKLVLGSKTQVEDSDIDQLPYLQAVIKETLRIHSVVPLLSYRADTTIQGYKIPEGSNIVVNLWAIHHDSRYWSDPDMFIPERFLQKEFDLYARNFEFVPFSSGKRICLGLPLANRMLPIILGSLVHQFELSLPEDARRNGIDMTEIRVSVVCQSMP